VDASIDATGSVAACRLAFEIGRKGSTTVVVGAFGVNELTLPAPGFHRVGKILKGSFYGDVDPIHGLRELADLYLAGQLKLDELIFRRTGHDQVNESLKSFEDPSLANAGRWVLEIA
jgi:S-(hydroxymethyl)glutathione dehydrogenase / alcohol dehydrogenase